MGVDRSRRQAGRQAGNLQAGAHPPCHLICVKYAPRRRRVVVAAPAVAAANELREEALDELPLGLHAGHGLLQLGLALRPHLAQAACQGSPRRAGRQDARDSCLGLGQAQEHLGELRKEWERGKGGVESRCRGKTFGAPRRRTYNPAHLSCIGRQCRESLGMRGKRGTVVRASHRLGITRLFRSVIKLLSTGTGKQRDGPLPRSLIGGSRLQFAREPPTRGEVHADFEALREGRNVRHVATLYA